MAAGVEAAEPFVLQAVLESLADGAAALTTARHPLSAGGVFMASARLGAWILGPGYFAGEYLVLIYGASGRRQASANLK